MSQSFGFVAFGDRGAGFTVNIAVAVPVEGACQRGGVQTAFLPHCMSVFARDTSHWKRLRRNFQIQLWIWANHIIIVLFVVALYFGPIQVVPIRKRQAMIAESAETSGAHIMPLPAEVATHHRPVVPRLSVPTSVGQQRRRSRSIARRDWLKDVVKEMNESARTGTRRSASISGTGSSPRARGIRARYAACALPSQVAPMPSWSSGIRTCST